MQILAKIQGCLHRDMSCLSEIPKLKPFIIPRMRILCSIFSPLLCQCTGRLAADYLLIVPTHDKLNASALRSNVVLHLVSPIPSLAPS